MIAGAEHGFLEVVLKLLAAGADPHSRGDTENALTMALENGHVEIAEALVTKGPHDPKVQCRPFWSATSHCIIMAFLMGVSHGRGARCRNW